MFQRSSFNQPIGDWDTSSVEQMQYMFQESQFNQPIGEWNIRKNVPRNKMFLDSQFNQTDILSKWDFGDVTICENGILMKIDYGKYFGGSALEDYFKNDPWSLMTFVPNQEFCS